LDPITEFLTHRNKKLFQITERTSKFQTSHFDRFDTLHNLAHRLWRTHGGLILASSRLEEVTAKKWTTLLLAPVPGAIFCVLAISTGGPARPGVSSFVPCIVRTAHAGSRACQAVFQVPDRSRWNTSRDSPVFGNDDDRESKI
jgi:hypothetical protein